MRPVNKAYYAGFTVLIVLLLGFAWVYRQSIMSQLNTQIRGQFTVAERLDQFGTSATQRLQVYFQQANLDFPPPKIALLAFKDSKQLQLYAPNKQGAWQWVHTYPIQAASGGLGPKLREGDKQVPEGLYQVELLNPNSLFHVSLRLNYPNAFDKQMAALDGREQLGGDIMIHGKAKSIGCLAMGDPAAEEYPQGTGLVFQRAGRGEPSRKTDKNRFHAIAFQVEQAFPKDGGEVQAGLANGQNRQGGLGMNLGFQNGVPGKRRDGRRNFQRNVRLMKQALRDFGMTRWNKERDGF